MVLFPRAALALVTALSLGRASCERADPSSGPLSARANSPGLDTQFLAAGDDVTAQGSSCWADDYAPQDVAIPEFAPYDEQKAKVYRYRKQISVNLGSWFVQENWMKPSLFRCASGRKEAELDVASGWENVKSARAALEKHWDTWITESDFEWLSQKGVNTVRLPIGYWSLGPEFCKGTPFEGVASVYEFSWPRVMRSIKWAEQHNIGVLVDLHGAVGSQNGQSHAGTSDGQMHLFDNDDNMRKTTDVLVYLTKQLVQITNVVGIQILNEPRNVASLPDFYARTIDTLRKLSPEAAKFPFYIHDGFNLERFAKFVGDRNDFVVQDHHSYFVFTPSDASRSAKDHTLNIKGPINSTLASASKQARHNLVIDEWSCALTPQSLSSESDKPSARRSFCTAQSSVYLQQTAGWSFWSYKTENCDVEDGWCFRRAIGRSLPNKFSVWDNPNQKSSGNAGLMSVLGSSTGGQSGGLLLEEPSDIVRRANVVSAKFQQLDKLASSPITGLGAAKRAYDSTSKDPISDWTTPLGPPAPEADDMFAASIVSDSGAPLDGVTVDPITDPYPPNTRQISRTISRSRAVRRAGQPEFGILAASGDAGYQDGYAAAIAFGESDGSRLGFATQFMEDSLAARLASKGVESGKENEYRESFIKGLADGEAKVMKDF